MWRNHVAELFIGQNSIVRAFGRPQPNREFAEIDRPLARPRRLPLLQIAAHRNGRADKSALVSVAQYAGSSVYLPIYLIDPTLAINTERLFHVCYRRRLESNSVAVEVESAAGRRLCVFREGLRERVARLFKRIFACDGVRVPVKELALAVDV